MIDIYHGDCLEIMATLDANSIDAIVTDPPYGLSFMGKGWDHGVPGVEFWAEALRVAKPGCHLLAFGGTRTFHRLAVAIEDAGWEIRDCVMWVYGSGFPKSHDVSKAIDKAAGAEREVVATIRKTPSAASENMNEGWRRPWAENAPKTMDITAPATDAARQWSGWGTALKPAWEPIIVARKPLRGTVAGNVLEWGTGGINVDGCRIGANGDKLDGGRVSTKKEGWDRPWKHDAKAVADCIARGTAAVEKAEQLGRWPANLIHDGSEEVTDLLVDAARFFYCPKASKRDRDEGLRAFEEQIAGGMSGRHDGTMGSVTMSRNHHPTVKPTDLMRYLCRLVTPPGGVVLDPFTGSGSTGKAAMLEGFGFIGIEREADYVEIARARCKEGGLLANAW